MGTASSGIVPASKVFSRGSSAGRASTTATSTGARISNDNVLTIYGRDELSRIADPARPGHVFSWLISASFDDKGNAIVYDYVAENDQGVDLAAANERNRVRTANRYLSASFTVTAGPLARHRRAEFSQASHMEFSGLEICRLDVPGGVRLRRRSLPLRTTQMVASGFTAPRDCRPALPGRPAKMLFRAIDRASRCAPTGCASAC